MMDNDNYLSAVDDSKLVHSMKDDVSESRKRMLQIALDRGLAFDDLADAVKHLKRNIIVGNTLEMDFELDLPCLKQI